jgi:hypothetical protein
VYWKNELSSASVSLSEGLGRSKCDFVCMPVDSVDIAAGIEKMFYVEHVGWRPRGELLVEMFHVEH